MAIAELVREVLREEHADVIRESVRAVARELMEAEVCELIGAEHGERTEDRAAHRNGYRAWRVDQLVESWGCGSRSRRSAGSAPCWMSRCRRFVSGRLRAATRTCSSMQ